ncbi:MAG: response regulator transcription factor [Kibdelosporangium sp.]
MRLLLVEADSVVASGLARELRGHGFAVDVLDSGAALLVTPIQCDLVLLGLELPDLDGLEVCRRLRASCQVPVIGLAGRDSELDRVLGFQAGLDEYVTRPVGILELVARIEAVLRRVRQPMPEMVPQRTSHAETLAHGALRISLRTREVRVGDRPVPVTPKEFDLLALLASEPGTVFSRRRIMTEVWNDPGKHSSRTIDTHVGVLRAKLGARSWVVNVRGIGYRLGHG